jgi:hypothetical protein
MNGNAGSVTSRENESIVLIFSCMVPVRSESWQNPSQNECLHVSNRILQAAAWVKRSAPRENPISRHKRFSNEISENK